MELERLQRTSFTNNCAVGFKPLLLIGNFQMKNIPTHDYNQLYPPPTNRTQQEFDLSVIEPYTEPTWYLNDADDGFFFIMKKNENSDFVTEAYPVHRLEEVLSLHQNSNSDVWISQATFYRTRRTVENVRSVALSFVDIDCDELPWAKDLTPLERANFILQVCDESSIPRPSVIVHSGRGLHLKWLYTKAIPHPALTRWSVVEKHLVEKFRAFGADPKATDAARFLRLVATTNTKAEQSKNRCEVVYVNVESTLDGSICRYEFDKFADQVLPFTRQQIREFRKLKKEQAKSKETKSKQTKWNPQTINAMRAEDLEKLVELRGGMPEGKRMICLFWQMNFMCLAGRVTEENFDAMVSLLAMKIDPRWDFRLGDLVTVRMKMRVSRKAGTDTHRIELYTPKTEKLISDLEITLEEQRQLKTLASLSVKQERRQEAREMRRREANIMPRALYISRAEQRCIRAHELRAKGLSIRAIAKEMELSVGAISGYLKKEIPSVQSVQSPVYYLGYPLPVGQEEQPLERFERGLVERKGGKGEGEAPESKLSTGLIAITEWRIGYA